MSFMRRATGIAIVALSGTALAGMAGAPAEATVNNETHDGSKPSVSTSKKIPGTPSKQFPGYFHPGPSVVTKYTKEVKTSEDSPSGKAKVTKEGQKVASAPIYKVVGVKSAGSLCGIKKIHRTTGQGPGEINQRIDQGMSVEVNVDAAISAKALSTGVGFSVTKSRTVSDTQALPVPKGKLGIIDSYPLYHMYNVKVADMSSGKLPETGSVAKPVGVCFSTGLK